MFRQYNFYLLFKTNLLLTMLLFVAFLSFNPIHALPSFVLSFMGALSTAATLVLILYIGFYLLSYLKTSGLYLMGLLFSLMQFALIVDFFIYRLYHFHINAMVLNILSSPAAMDSIQLGLAPYIAVVVILLVLLALQFFTIRILQRTNEQKKRKLNSKLNKLIITPLFLVILIEKVSFGLADAYANSAIVSKFQVIPLYQPLTFSSFAAKHLGIKPQEVATAIVTNKHLLNYPLEPLSYLEQPNKVNIFIFASDSVRRSSISSELTPNVAALAQDGMDFQNHYSGGNATRFGIFSLIYGLNSTYWFKFLAANQGPVLFTALNHLDYQIDILSSTDTNWPEFRMTCYVDVQSSIQDKFTGLPWEKDRQNMDVFKQNIEAYKGDRALFSFVFLDAPHGNSYPDTHAKYQPDGKGKVNYLNVDKQVAQGVLLNQYKNAVAYDDALFGEAIASLKAKGLYEDAIVIFTSDHGQEFYEYGFFGHNSAFSRAQTQVPMIIKFPKQAPRVISQLTSHVDIAPTLLNYIGVSTPAEQFSNGHNLLSKNYARSYANSSSWNHSAIINDETTMVFSNMPDKFFSNQLRYTHDYKEVAKSEAHFDQGLILQLLKENRKFLK